MAETYHVFNYSELPPLTVARFFLGLRDSSRTKQAIAGVNVTSQDMFLASILDKLNWLCWTKTKDAEKGRNRPESILSILMGEDKKGTDDVTVFTSSDAFDLAIKQFEKEE